MSTTLSLTLEMHGIGHKFEDKDNQIVTNMKWVNIDVFLYHGNIHITNHIPIPLRAYLLFENGGIVSAPDDSGTLIGSIDSTIINGKGTFKLKISPKLTSEMQNKQRFRVRIVATDGLCSAHTPPFKVMTKIDRKMSRSQAANTLASLVESGDVSAHPLVQLALEHDKSIQALHAQNQTIFAEIAALREMLAEKHVSA